MKNLKIEDIETLERLPLDEMEQVVGGMDCPGRRGSVANLTRINLTDADLTGANLTDANLTNAILWIQHLLHKT